MKVLDRLKMELNNRRYFEDSAYEVFLQENELNITAEYNKDLMKIALLCTVKDILSVVCNDTTCMANIKTEFNTVDEAYKWIKDRIKTLEIEIKELEQKNITNDNENPSPFTLLFSGREY